MFASLFTLALTGAVAVGMLRLLSPRASRSITGWIPTGDRGVDRWIAGQTERRGALLCALALGAIAEAVGAGRSLGLLLVGGVAALAFRWAPEPVGVALGVLGAIFALVALFDPACGDLDGSHRPVGLALSIAGLAVFGVLRWMFSGGGLALGSPRGTVLAGFGVVALGAFVAGPFGADLAEATGLGHGFHAVVALYAVVVVAGAALLPSFATSVIGMALLAATLSADLVIGAGCDGIRGATLVVLLGFVTVWFVVGRWFDR